MASAPSLVGQNVPRSDGYDKVSGRALFVDDLTVPGMWHGAAVRCPHARAKVVAVDLSQVPSDAVVLTAKDLPGPNVIKLIADDWPVLAAEEVHHAFEPVALVAAPTREQALVAAQAVRVSYEPSPATLTLDAALAQGAPAVLAKCNIDEGDVGAAFADPDLLHIEGVYETGYQEHLYIETNGILALAPEDGSIEVVGSMQCPYYVHKALAYLFGEADERVRVRQAVTGGGFGGKEDYPDMIAAHAALLARKAGRPVKIIYDRHEDIVATTKRHPSRVRIKSAVRRDGTFVAHDIEVLMDGGAYVTLSPVVLSRGVLHASGPYRCPNVRVRGRALRTSTCPNGAFRGFGAPQTQLAIERHVDRIARAVGQDPLSLREKNALELGDHTATGQKLTSSVSARQCLAAAEERTGFRERWRAYEAERQKGRPDDGKPWPGIGLALFWHGCGFTGNGEKHIMAKAAVELSADGTVEIKVASTDIGQGTIIAFEMLVAEALGIPLAQVKMPLPDTRFVPNSGPTVASRTIMVVGETVARAAAGLVSKLGEHVAKERGLPKVSLRDGVFWDARGDKVTSFRDAALGYLAAHGGLRVEEQWRPLAEQQFDETTYRGMAYPAFGWGCDVVEVLVDPDTLMVRPTRVVAVCDVGKVIHPALCQGQVDGGTLQAVAWGYLEEIKLKDGRYQNDRLATYIIPTSLDAPELESVLIENPGPVGPMGAKGVGELPMDGGAPALLAAIENAVGIVATSIPATPERLLTAYKRGGKLAGAPNLSGKERA